MAGLQRYVTRSSMVTALLLSCGHAATLRAQRTADPPISVDAITDKPDIFIGHRVRFAGDVAKVTGPRALTLKDQDPSQKEQILVITRRPINQMLGEGGASLESGDKVLVTGVVHRSDFAAIERELGLDLDADTEKRFRGKPVVIVSEMVRTESHEPDEPDTAHARE